MIKMIVLSAVILFVSCNSNHTHKVKIESVDIVDSVNNQGMDSTDASNLMHSITYVKSLPDSPYSCDSLIESLVRNSNVDTAVLQFLFKVEEVYKDSVIGKFYNINEEKAEVAITWLLVLPKKNELLDISIDPDKPIHLRFNQKMMQLIRSNCSVVK
jgi:hypothetical protein